MGSSVCITFADAFIRNDSWLLRCLQQGSRFIISLGSVARSCQWQGSGSVMIGGTCSWGHTGVFLKWWYPQNNPKWSFLVGKPIVVGYHHFRKPLYCSWKKSGKLTSWGYVGSWNPMIYHGFFPSQVVIAGFLPSNSYWRLPNKYLKKSDEHQFGLVIHSMISASIYNSKLSGWLISPLVEPRRNLLKPCVTVLF